MAGIKGSFSKGLTTINVKASNFMEENKLKTHKATVEAEIERLKQSIGEKVYQAYRNGNFDLEIVQEELDALTGKNEIIQKINAEIESLTVKEAEILGSTANPHGAQEPVRFCSMCGTPNRMEYKFCEKCGNKLE